MTDTDATEMIASSVEGGIRSVTLNRPDALNAFRPEMLHALRDVFRAAQTDGETKVIVLEGAGRAFSAGVDLKVLQGVTPVAGKISGIFDEPAYEAATAIRQCNLPVIAKVHGACFTGALEIALHCDIIYTTADTKFGDTHAKFGIRPTWGMTQTLPRAVGIRRARELSFTARTFSGADAANWGLANEACDNKEALDALVAKRASEIAANSSAVIAAYKDLHQVALQNRPMEEAIAEEQAREYPDITDTEERLAGFR
ncbi:enoyl-CoA hydratase/isomerase family protein [Parvularcula sp. IMCC14364]|uniref:enoyl-CoA hydratase/isomerase family protein n=1 Tax=Parvularcula sp. IMCC14364 TaxID=3067902 RepID=UPI0027421750|nr:enoyl-CoA hydratase/isomerase family protein [Parvularcula sp. IMCC14364]